MVTKAKNSAGDAAKSADPKTRGGCSWNGLNDYQYRWMNVALQRFDSVAGIGSAEEQAHKWYQEQVTNAQSVKGSKTSAATGTGDEASTVTAQAPKDKVQYEDVTVIARTGNVVIVLFFSGAGFQNAPTPSAADMQKAADGAAKEAVAAVAAANA
jgi:hypothetical protein